jgi:PRTRC genetic system protein E
MFTELMPLLADRTVLITVARESDTTLRATLVPRRAKEGDNPALSTPLSFVGTPEELDREMPRGLAEYVETHHRLSTTLAQAKAEMEAAAKAVQEEAKRKSEERRKAKSTTSVPMSTGSNEAPAPTETKPVAPAGSGLFESAAAEQAPSQQGGLRL